MINREIAEQNVAQFLEVECPNFLELSDEEKLSALLNFWRLQTSERTECLDKIIQLEKEAEIHLIMADAAFALRRMIQQELEYDRSHKPN